MNSPNAPQQNKIYDTLPAHQTSCYVYREAPWVSLLLLGTLSCIAFGIAYVAVISAFKVHPLFTVIAFIGFGTLVYAISFLHSADKAINFVASSTGLYFPERKLFKRTSESWLFVPWRNVLDYRVQLLFDETSSRGLVLELVASREEETRYFVECRMFRPAGARHSSGMLNSVMVGYSTFMPRPRDVLVQLRKLDSLTRPDEEATPEMSQLSQKAQLLQFHYPPLGWVAVSGRCHLRCSK